MAVKVTTTGSGAFKDGTSTENVVSLSVDIDSSPLLLGDYSSGSTNISVATVADLSSSINNSAMMIDNQLTVSEPSMGSISGKVNSVSINEFGGLSISARTIIDYLNIDVDFAAMFGYYSPDTFGTIISAFGDGFQVTYSFNPGTPYGFLPDVGDMVDVSGFSSTQYNLKNAIVTSKFVDTSIIPSLPSVFTVTSTATGASSGSGFATRLKYSPASATNNSNPLKLKNAIDYYFYEINRAYGTKVDYSTLTVNPNVSIPAWSGNFLQRIKEMCAIYRIRFWASGDTYYFSDMSENVIDVSQYPVSVSAASNVLGREIYLTNYNAQLNAPSTPIYYHNDVISFDAGGVQLAIEVETKDVNIARGSYSVNIVDSSYAQQYINGEKYLANGSAFVQPTTSFMSVCDANDVPIPAAAYGIATGTTSGTIVSTGTGKVTLYITPPNDPGFIQLFPGPYKLAVESLDGDIVSSLVICAGGLKLFSTQTSVNLGSASADAVAVEFESPFIYNAETAGIASYYASAFYGKGEISANLSMPATTQQMSTVDNIRFYYNYNKYKVSTASIDYPQMQVNAEPATTIADLDAIWSGKTIANLNAKIGGFTVGDWSAVPLVK